MDYRKPWSFWVGVVVFGALGFLAATGRSVGWGQAEGGSSTPTTAPAVVPAPQPAPNLALLADVRP